MSRQNARESAVRLLYQCEMTGEAPLLALEGYFTNVQPDDADLYLPMSDSDIEYLKGVLSGVEKEISVIDDAISANAKGWKINRISKTLISIMRVAIYEMLYVEEVPFKVSLNEAIELSKDYDGEDAAPFVNGILGGVVKQFKLCD